ncbi:MAG: glutamate mutase L, partial [Candidatus Marinimicrobia bacterium]|nr:glutamate mutase L [Candidatus Neomarinimicrobiota bacterium]
MVAGNKLKTILATDCGSTTTKAILIELTDQGYRLKTRGEAPTTVEAPFEDVTKGVLNAIMEVEELSGLKI